MSRKRVAVIHPSVLVVDSVVPRVKRVPNRLRDMDPPVLRRSVVRRVRAIGVLRHAVSNIVGPVIQVRGADTVPNETAHVSRRHNECTVPRHMVPKVGMRREVLRAAATKPSTSDMDTGAITASRDMDTGAIMASRDMDTVDIMAIMVSRDMDIMDITAMQREDHMGADIGRSVIVGRKVTRSTVPIIAVRWGTPSPRTVADIKPTAGTECKDMDIPRIAVTIGAVTADGGIISVVEAMNTASIIGMLGADTLGIMP